MALGPVLAVVAYVIVVDLPYSGGIGHPALISVSTWVANLLVLYGAAYLGDSPF